MLYKATKYMYAEDANIAWGCKGKKRDNQDDARLDRRRKSTWTNEKREDVGQDLLDEQLASPH